MTRACIHCHRDFGEKCAHCGSTHVLTVGSDPAGAGHELLRCTECGHRWVRGEEAKTHGICEECLPAQLAEIRK